MCRNPRGDGSTYTIGIEPVSNGFIVSFSSNSVNNFDTHIAMDIAAVAGLLTQLAVTRIEPLKARS